MLILQSSLQNGVVIKTYTARLSLPASCVSYVTRQVCLKINTLSHARSWKYGKYSASASHMGRRRAIFFRILRVRACVITYNVCSIQYIVLYFVASTLLGVEGEVKTKIKQRKNKHNKISPWKPVTTDNFEKRFEFCMYRMHHANVKVSTQSTW